MNRLAILIFSFLLISVSFSAAIAGDYADFKFIGFSMDGKYAAFEESGEWDGSGGSYATTYFINVGKNNYALPPTIFERPDDPSPQDRGFRSNALYSKNVAIKLKRLNIVRGNTGRQVVAHLLNDWSFVTPIQREHPFYDADGIQKDRFVTDYEGGMIRRNGGEVEKVVFNPDLWAYTQNTEDFFELTLTPSAIKSEQCSDGYKIELTLNDNTHKRALPLQILQKDTDNIPKSRNCPFGYHIEQVYFYKDRLAVFLNAFSQGFEGPDMRYMVVTGELENESNGPGWGPLVPVVTKRGIDFRPH